MGTQAFNNVGWSNYQVIGKEEYEDVFSFQTQLPPLDFSGLCVSTMEESTVLDAVPLTEIFLNDPFYSPLDLPQNHAPISDAFVCNSGIESGVLGEMGTGLIQADRSEQQLILHDSSNVKFFDEELQVEGKKIVERSRGIEKNNTGGHSKNLSRKTISQYFYMPITQAARELNIGLTLLKKRCRELGIRRWPHRKLMSLQTLIKNVQELEKEEGDRGKLRESIEVLEQEKKLLEEIPDMNLEDKTKRLRQACFKANYKKRKQMGMVDTSSKAAAESTNNNHCFGSGKVGIDEEEDEELKYLLSDCFSSNSSHGLML